MQDNKDTLAALDFRQDELEFPIFGLSDDC